MQTPRWIVFEHLTLHATNRRVKPETNPNVTALGYYYYQHAEHTPSELCSTKTALLAHSGDQKTYWQRPVQHINQLTGAKLRDLVDDKSWAGMLRMTQSTAIMTTIASELWNVSVQWVDGLTQIVFDYLDRAELENLVSGTRQRFFMIGRAVPMLCSN